MRSRGIWAIALIGLSAPALADPATSGVTYVYLHGTNETPIFTVNSERVGAKRLGLVALEHAIEDNPNMMIANIYRDARLLICAETQIGPLVREEVLRFLTDEGFGNVSFGELGVECPAGEV
jgi:hypothetical protein